MIHMTSTAQRGQSWSVFCRCPWASEGHGSLEQARAAGDAHLEQANAAPPVPAGPKVEVCAQWDPDGGGNLTVFVDGVQVPAHVEWVDPGAGHTLDGWREHTHHVLTHPQYSQGFADLVVADRFEAESSQYIDQDESPDYDELVRGVGEAPETYKWRASFWVGELADVPQDEEIRTVYSPSQQANDALGAWAIRAGYTTVHLEGWYPDVDQGPLNRGWAMYGHLHAEDHS